MVKMFVPKNVSIILTIAKTNNVITKPIIALTSVPRAASIAVLSPPEVIQRMPPTRAVKKKIITAAINAKPIRAGTKDWKNSTPPFSCRGFDKGKI